MENNEDCRARVMKDELSYVFDKVNDWLKFAETKHAALITFDTAVLFGSLNFLNRYNLTSSPGVVLVVLVVGIIFSLVVSLISFMPRTNITGKFVNAKTKPVDSNNLLFYGHIAKYSLEEYCAALSRCFQCQLSYWDKMLANEIIVNSKIAMRKYNLFNISVYIIFTTAIASMVMVVFLGIRGILCR